jgi:hypothetical protein
MITLIKRESGVSVAAPVGALLGFFLLVGILYTAGLMFFDYRLRKQFLDPDEDCAGGIGDIGSGCGGDSDSGNGTRGEGEGRGCGGGMGRESEFKEEGIEMGDATSHRGNNSGGRSQYSLPLSLSLQLQLPRKAHMVSSTIFQNYEFFSFSFFSFLFLFW